jgi:hypothetical protein
VNSGAALNKWYSKGHPVLATRASSTRISHSHALHVAKEQETTQPPPLSLSPIEMAGCDSKAESGNVSCMHKLKFASWSLSQVELVTVDP